MIGPAEEEVDSTLILAAEECPPNEFEALHKFSSSDDQIIRKLVAHGPVLIRGGRGSGKSALLIEAHRRMAEANLVVAVYVSLRYLPLLQSDGDEYIGHFCKLLSKKIQDELSARNNHYTFPTVSDQASLQENLVALAQSINKRVVLLFDDAAHIGREKPLEVFFDLFRTISSSLVSCKASIYPGVTKFGTRFDVYNDSTVIEISRSDISRDRQFFVDVLRARYPHLASADRFSDRLSPEQFANIIGRAVVGNMRGFILACNRFDTTVKISIPDVNTCLLALATDYYWPLMDEVAPKLGVYEPLINPAREVMEAIVDHAVRPSHRQRTSAQDRVLVHRQLIAQFSKIFEVLEYLGFVARREASRALKSGGRGAVFALNLCNLLDKMPSQRLTIEAMEEWISGSGEIAEIHVSGQTFQSISLPPLAIEQGLAILLKPIQVLAKSPAYPYGLTPHKISLLVEANFLTVGQLAAATDYDLRQIHSVGKATVRRMRDVVFQAVWM
ncbi:hypothetical protein NKI72_32250 [Mesorhizobium sp. M0437]|uniref:hypothetical protein n=1 Tax=Mesorhizobium sp. M0437 TaxID=2956945 RepID=UPI003339E453